MTKFDSVDLAFNPGVFLSVFFLTFYRFSILVFFIFLFRVFFLKFLRSIFFFFYVCESHSYHTGFLFSFVFLSFLLLISLSLPVYFSSLCRFIRVRAQGEQSPHGVARPPSDAKEKNKRKHRGPTLVRERIVCQAQMDQTRP